MRKVFAVVLAATLTACSSVLGLGADEVTVRLEEDGLFVRNERSSAVHYMAIGENSLILWAPCVRADCPRIEAGASLLLPFDDVPAGAESARLSFHWWARQTGADGAPVPGPVHTITLRR